MPGTTAAARKSAEARIKTLCCLGLPAESIMPALLREVHAVIPSYGRTFFWAGETGALSNVYDENPDSAAIATLYIQEFYNRRECEVSKDFTRTMRTDAGVLKRDLTLTIEKSAFYKTDYYNLLHRPLGYDDFLRLMVRDGGRALGALMVWRAPGDPPFSAEDERRLARLEPFIAHALAEPGALDVPLAESGDSGLVLANRDGKPLYLSPEARRLLFLASHEAIAPGGAMGRPALLPAPVVRICRALRAVLAGKTDAPSPRWRHRNKWGGFVFRAYALEGPGAASGLIGITITREEPLALRLMGLAEGLALTRRQTQVCVQLARGHSTNAIAHSLGLSEHTVIAHERWIYDKLDVHNRVELVNRLLASAQAGGRAGPT